MRDRAISRATSRELPRDLSRGCSRTGDAATAAKSKAEVLVVSAFADVDGLYDKVGRAGHFAKALDAWTAQVSATSPHRHVTPPPRHPTATSPNSQQNARGGSLSPPRDATWQVYRGGTFGNFFEQMGNNTEKPVLLTEYGVDAYHDTCGQNAKSTAPCFNRVGMHAIPRHLPHLPPSRHAPSRPPPAPTRWPCMPLPPYRP